MKLNLAVLDGLRGLAALYVVLHHVRWLLWTGIDNYRVSGEHGLGLILASSQVFFRFGEQAVLLFFLLSGFCIHYRQAACLANGQAGEHRTLRLIIHWPDYAWRRFRRIYPPLLVAIIATALLDCLGARLNPIFYAGATPGYDAINYYLFARDNIHGLSTLVANLLLQADLALPAFGTDVALWSHAFEFWFYAMYPAVLLLSARYGPRHMFAAVAALSVVSLLLNQVVGIWPLRVTTYWVIWAAGAVIAEAYAERLQFNKLPRLAPAACLGILLLGINEVRPIVALPPGALPLAWSAALGVLFAYLLLALPDRLGRMAERTANYLKPLGNVSYSLYLLHCPCLALLSAWWLSWHTMLPLGVELGALGVGISLVLAVACWYAVERHCVSAPPRRPAAVSAMAVPVSDQVGVANSKQSINCGPLLTPRPEEVAS